MSHRKEKVAELIKQNAAAFLSEASDNTSLITVTNVELNPQLDDGTVYITVFPDERESDALAFAQRRQRDLHEYLKQHTELGRVPRLHIAIDEGEKRRQRLDELSRGEE